MRKHEYAGDIDPFDCLHATSKRVGEHILCDANGGSGVWVNCQTSCFGEPPCCRLMEPDNSDEARARRVAWMREHEE